MEQLSGYFIKRVFRLANCTRTGTGFVYAETGKDRTTLIYTAKPHHNYSIVLNIPCIRLLKLLALEIVK